MQSDPGGDELQNRPEKAAIFKKIV